MPADVLDQVVRDDVGLREKALWRMLHETAAQVGKCSRPRSSTWTSPTAARGSVARAIDNIIWQTGTARLLPRLIKGRKSGPVFLTDPRTRVPLVVVDTDRPTGRAWLNCRRAVRRIWGEVQLLGASTQVRAHMAAVCKTSPLPCQQLLVRGSVTSLPSRGWAGHWNG
jgi:hypothetical protein